MSGKIEHKKTQNTPLGWEHNPRFSGHSVGWAYCGGIKKKNVLLCSLNLKLKVKVFFRYHYFLIYVIKKGISYLPNNLNKVNTENKDRREFKVLTRQRVCICGYESWLK